MGDPLLTVLDLHKRYGARRILDGVSFTIHDGDRIGIVGVNGAGKSTLLRLVVTPDPDDPPDAGEIRRARGMTLTYVPQDPPLDPADTVAAVLEEGHRRRRAAQAALGHDVAFELAAVHDELHLPPLAAAVGTLSGGERRRLALAAGLLAHADVLALDEPTNHLDLETITWLERRLVTETRAVLLVTHDRAFLDAVATRILDLDRGKVHAYEGNYHAFLDRQAERLANEATREEKRSAFVRRELEWIRRGPAAQRKKDQARIDRFDAAVDAAPDAHARAPDGGGPRLRLPEGPRLGKTVLQLEKVEVRMGDRILVRPLDLLLKPGDRIGIVGPNGAGKTTLLRVMLGERPPDAGRVTIGINTVFTVLDQARTTIDDEATVLDAVAEGNDVVQLPGETVHVRTFLRGLLFDDATMGLKVGRLSGGERNRVVLAKQLRGGGNVLVLDEPTNDLDLQTLTVLEEALVAFRGCVLVVSHDRWFLDKVATAILRFEPGGRVIRHEGGWSRLPPLPVTIEERPGPVARAPASRKKLSFKEQKELDGIHAAIEAAEARVAELEATLADPATYKTGDARAVTLALDTARAEVERLYTRWSELEAAGTGYLRGPP